MFSNDTPLWNAGRQRGEPVLPLELGEWKTIADPSEASPLEPSTFTHDALRSFRVHCVCGIEANEDKMQENLRRSLMLVTALNPYIGYENAAKTAKKAFAENISLKEACVSLGFLSAERFDEVFRPADMI